MSTKTKNNVFTNVIGIILISIACLGVISRWFFPEVFHGDWYEVSLVFAVGMIFIFGIGDDFAKVILNRFKTKLDAGKDK